MITLEIIRANKQDSYFNLLQSLWKIIVFELDVWLFFSSVDLATRVCL